MGTPEKVLENPQACMQSPAPSAFNIQDYSSDSPHAPYKWLWLRVTIGEQSNFGIGSTAEAYPHVDVADT